MEKNSFDPYYRWLGIPASEQPANHYQLLGLTIFESDPEVIEAAAMRQMAHVRTYALGTHGELSQSLLSEIANAKLTLLNQQSKKQYDASLCKPTSQDFSTQNARDSTSSRAFPPVPVSCPNCAVVLAFSDQSFGKQVQCSQCKTALQISSDGSQCSEVPQPSTATKQSTDSPFESYANSDFPSFPTGQVNQPRGRRIARKKADQERSSNSWIAAIAVPLGGILGVFLAIVILWIIFKSDPLGTIVSDTNVQQHDLDAAILHDSNADQSDSVLTEPAVDDSTRFDIGAITIPETSRPMPSVGSQESDNTAEENLAPSLITGVTETADLMGENGSSSNTPGQVERESVSRLTVDNAKSPPPAIVPFDSKQAKAHQVAWAKYLGVPVEFQNPIGMKFVLIPPGEFQAGAVGDGQDLAGRFKVEQKQVSIDRPYYIATAEMTEGQATKLGWTGSNDSTAVSDLPVTKLQWHEAVRLLNNLSRTENLPVNYQLQDGRIIDLIDVDGYRLPSADEWEFASRSGTGTRYFFGDKPLLIEEYSSLKSVDPVASRKPNAFGLYDVHGNATEWVQQSGVHEWKDDDGSHMQEMRGLVNPKAPYQAANDFRNWQKRHYPLAVIGVRALLEISDATKKQILVNDSVARGIASKPQIQASKQDGSKPQPAIAPFDVREAKVHQKAWAVHLDILSI